MARGAVRKRSPGDVPCPRFGFIINYNNNMPWSVPESHIAKNPGLP